MLTAALALTGGPIQDLSVYGWTDAMLVLLEASCNAELYLNFPRGAIKSCNFFVRLGWPHFNTHIRQLYKKKENIEKWNIEFGIFFVISHLHFVCKTFRRHSRHVRPTSSNKLGFLIWMLECRGVIMCAAAVRLCVFLCRLPGGRVESSAMYSSAKRSVHLDHQEEWDNRKSLMHKMPALLWDTNTDCVLHSAK